MLRVSIVGPTKKGSVRYYGTEGITVLMQVCLLILWVFVIMFDVKDLTALECE